MRRLVTAEQRTVNTAIGQRLQTLGRGADVAAQGGAHIALQQGFAPRREMDLEIGELRQVGTQLHGSEAPTEDGMEQGANRDGGCASEGKRGFSHLSHLCFRSET